MLYCLYIKDYCNRSTLNFLSLRSLSSFSYLYGLLSPLPGDDRLKQGVSNNLHVKQIQGLLFCDPDALKQHCSQTYL